MGIFAPKSVWFVFVLVLEKAFEITQNAYRSNGTIFIYEKYGSFKLCGIEI